MATTNFKGQPVKLIGEFIQVGKVAPDFELVKSDLSSFALKDLKGKNIVLNIFPSLDTGVCATSVRKFNKMAAGMKDTVVLGADTVVVLDGSILGKPSDEEDAFRMLFSLQGRTHEVYTGVAVLELDSEGNRRTVNHAVGTKVYVCGMTEREIREYIATGEPMDKAGAYGIQGAFAKFIDRIDGDYYNVVGLPVSYVYQALFREE